MNAPAKTYEVVRYEFGQPPASVLITTEREKAERRARKGNDSRTAEEIASRVRFKTFSLVDGRYSVLQVHSTSEATEDAHQS